MPPSVEVSPSSAAGQNKDKVNNNANDVMSALSLAMANALLDHQGGNQENRYREEELPNLSEGFIPTASRASSNDGLSIWGSSTTSSSYDFLSNERKANNLSFLRETRNVPEASPASLDPHFNFSKFKTGEPKQYGYRNGYAPSPPNVSDSYSSDSSTRLASNDNKWGNTLFKQENEHPAPTLFDTSRQRSPHYHSSPYVDGYKHQFQSPPTNRSPMAHPSNLVDDYERRNPTAPSPYNGPVQVVHNNMMENYSSQQQQVFVMAVPVQQDHQMIQSVQMVPVPPHAHGHGQPTLILPHPLPFSPDPRAEEKHYLKQPYRDPSYALQSPSHVLSPMHNMHTKKMDKRGKNASPHHRMKHEYNDTPFYPKEDIHYRAMPEVNDPGIVSSSSESITSLYHSPQRPHLSILLGHVRRLSKDQVGCRLLQQSLDEDGPQAATAILREGLPFLAETMTDPFGNYLFQKILEKVSSEERLELITTVSPRLVNAALNLHGTRSVQKVVELSVMDHKSSTYPAAEVVTHALSPSAARLCIDSHGNHVIQRILQKFPLQYSKFIFDAVAQSVGDVARHRHGCCVIQRCLDSSTSPARSNLVKRIVDKALDLMQDAYGNYVVQYVLDVCNDEEASAVCESVIGRVGLLAIQKFSSNVMEKCLERSNDYVKELYLREISCTDKIRELMADPFGNYVVQRALAVSTHAQAIRLVESMRPHLQGMRNTAGGRRIIAKICRRFPDFDLNHVVRSLEEQLNAPRLEEYDHSSTSSNIGIYLSEFGGHAM